MREREESRLLPRLVPGEQCLQKMREPKREKRVNVMHFKWLWSDSLDVSRMLWFWSSQKKSCIKLQISSW